MTQLSFPAPTCLDELDRLRHLRHTEPICHDAKSGAWSVYPYAEVAAILSDAHTFWSNFGEVVPAACDVLLEGNIVATDPPRHDQRVDGDQSIATYARLNGARQLHVQVAPAAVAPGRRG